VRSLARFANLCHASDGCAGRAFSNDHGVLLTEKSRNHLPWAWNDLIVIHYPLLYATNYRVDKCRDRSCYSTGKINEISRS
jgi:hypothetical protein